MGASVAHGVGERLAQDRRKAVGDVCGCMLGHNFKLNLRTAVRARAFDNAFELHGKVDGVVVERVDAGAHKLERLVNRAFDVGEIGGNPGLVGVHDAQGLGLQRGARELVADVIVDLARDTGAFGECRELDFVVLAIGKVAVARFERESSFLQLVADAAHALLLALNWAVRSDNKVAATERMAVSRSVRAVSASARRSATSAKTKATPMPNATQTCSRRTRRAMS